MSAPSSICKQPVVAVVGHIDHGKTTLLDYIRKSAVAMGEVGGITQRISAYEITRDTPEGSRSITFIDTPGHEAFQKMRERGAKAADIAILVVAADDGVKPQTIEAHRAIAEAKIPFIVAFTKIDKDTANIERAKESVMRENIFLEGLGGDVPYAGVSGKSGVGIPELLDLILLSSDLHEISCDSSAPVEAVVIESARDPRSGVSATVIVRKGTLSTGGFAVAAHAFAPLRVIEDYTGAKVRELSCGKPARITGFTEAPPVGSVMNVVQSKKIAEIETQKATRFPVRESETVSPADDQVIVRAVIKADTAGSLEAMEYELGKISAERVQLSVVSKGVGAVTESDVKHVIGFSPAVILGFNVKVEPVAKDLADRQNILLETRSIIYELTDWLAGELKKHAPKAGPAMGGTASVLRHFSTQGSKHVIGGRVIEGMVALTDRVTIERRGIEVGHGKIVNLQMQKADVKEVQSGMEFGAQVDSKSDIIAGDSLKAEKRS